MKNVAGIKLVRDSEMGSYVVIYEQEFPMYQRMSVGAIANRIIVLEIGHRPSFKMKLIFQAGVL